ncbi:hypothetical protein ACFYP4_02435 [Streptomyces sp. NPDC005551]|uniref:hypothetical protein n=1 Tax=Streptomyces sp. NPDC005551 TaxID=3364725 RepID=UPI00369F9E7A
MNASGEARGLEDLIEHMSELELGAEYEVADNYCRYCGSTRLVFVMKLVAIEGSLAGGQAKTSAKAWPWLRCKGCGWESKGKRWVSF